MTFPSALAIGLASILAYLLGVVITRPKFAETRDDTARLLMTVGAASLLPATVGRARFGLHGSRRRRRDFQHYGQCCSAGRRSAGRYRLCRGDGAVYDGHGQRVCGVLRHYRRHRYSVCNPAGRRSRDRGRFGHDSWLLRHADDADGGELQHRAGGGSGNQNKYTVIKAQAADGVGHDRRSRRADACAGILSRAQIDEIKRLPRPAAA